MPNTQDIPIWHQRVQAAIDFQSKQHTAWREIISFLKGEYLGGKSPHYELSEMNFVYEYEKVKTGSIYARNPHIFCRARSTPWVRFAETMEQVINYTWLEQHLKQKIKQTTRHSILIPPAWIEIGYKGDLQRTPTGATEGEQGIFDETIKNDNVFTKFRSPWEVVFPEGYHDIRTSPYLIRIEEIPLIDLYANPQYNDNKYSIPVAQAAHRRRQPTKFLMSANIPIANDITQDNETIKIKLFHIWDQRSQERFTLAEGYHDATLFERPWTYLIDGFPLYPLVFNEIPRTDTDVNSYPMSDVTPMVPQLRDLSLFNTAMMKHGKRGAGVIITRKGALPPEQITNLQNARDIDVVELEMISPDAISTFVTPSLPSDWYRLREVIIDDLMRVSGFQQLLAQQRGIETATESENLRAGQLIRQAESVDVMEDFTVDIARGLSGLLWQFYDKNRVAEIIGEQVSEQMWPELPDESGAARKIVQQELQFRIDAGSTRPPKDEAVERKMWSDAVFGLAAAYPHRIKEDRMLVQYLKKIDFKDVEDLVITNDDAETAAAQEENQLLLQGMKQVVSPNENHQLHLQVHAQVQQTPGLPPTPEHDEHVLKHAQFMEMKQPRMNPQRGDTKPSAATTNPELARRGVPENVDLQGAATSGAKGIGVNV